MNLFTKSFCTQSPKGKRWYPCPAYWFSKWSLLGKPPKREQSPVEHRRNLHILTSLYMYVQTYQRLALTFQKLANGHGLPKASLGLEGAMYVRTYRFPLCSTGLCSFLGQKPKKGIEPAKLTNPCNLQAFTACSLVLLVLFFCDPGLPYLWQKSILGRVHDVRDQINISRLPSLKSLLFTSSLQSYTQKPISLSIAFPRGIFNLNMLIRLKWLFRQGEV